MIEITAQMVLLVGDMRLSAAQQAALVRLPARLSQVATLAEATSLLETRRPTAVLLGVRGMPSAVQSLAEQIAQMGLAIPIIVLAQRPTVRGATTALQLGAADYLGCTVSPARLVQAVRRAMVAAGMTPMPMRHNAQGDDKPPTCGNSAEKEAALRDKDDLISLVSHELRTPLMAINGYLEILQKYHAKLSREKTDDFIGRSLQATGELAYLADMLVQVLQFEAGRLAPRFSAVPVAPLIHSAIEQCDLLVGDHTITTEVAADLIVRADGMALQQIIRNLLSNAIKYSPLGGTITVTANRAAGDMIEIAVRDEGIGIAPEQVPQLFQRFARVHSTAAWPNIRGTGLGLYICRQLITAHGGHIWVESVLGQGSIFHVRLPIAAADLADILPTRYAGGPTTTPLSNSA